MTQGSWLAIGFVVMICLYIGTRLSVMMAENRMELPMTNERRRLLIHAERQTRRMVERGEELS